MTPESIAVLRERIERAPNRDMPFDVRIAAMINELDRIEKEIASETCNIEIVRLQLLGLDEPTARAATYLDKHGAIAEEKIPDAVGLDTLSAKHALGVLEALGVLTRRGWLPKAVGVWVSVSLAELEVILAYRNARYRNPID